MFPEILIFSIRMQRLGIGNTETMMLKEWFDSLQSGKT